MKLGSRQSALRAMGAALVCLLGVGLVRGQAGPGQRPQIAEEVYIHVQLL